MGSWSVYCEVSRMAITAGDDCLLVPLRRTDAASMRYQPWYFVCPPIRGRYNDYGGIELDGREDTPSGRLLSAHYGMSLKEFCAALTDHRHVEEPALPDVSFMWLAGTTWDLMRTYKPCRWPRAGHFRMGGSGFLESAGAVPVGTDSLWDLYELGDTVLRADGDRLEYPVPGGWTYLSGLSHLQQVSGVDLSRFGAMVTEDLWRFEKGADWRAKNLMHPFGMSSGFVDVLSMRRLMSKALGKPLDADRDPKDMWRRMMRSISDDALCAELADVVTFESNLCCMSGVIRPTTPFVTPQCGEREEHQFFLDAFAEANRRRVEQDRDDDEED